MSEPLNTPVEAAASASAQAVPAGLTDWLDASLPWWKEGANVLLVLLILLGCLWVFQRKGALMRRFFQVVGTLVPNGYLLGFIPPGVLYQGPTKGFCVPTLNCYACPGSIFACPMGTFQHFIIIRTIPFYFIGWLGTMCLSVGRMACGTLCPFGFMQDILFKFRAFKVKLHPALTHLKYAVLVGLAILIPYFTLQPWFSKLCPCGTLIGGLPWVTINREIRSMMHELFWVKTAMLILVVATAAMIKRPFCRVICPLGALFSLFNRVSFLRLRWDAELCTHCDKCTRICPMDISVYQDANNHNCIRCLDCTQCPAVRVTTAFSAAPVRDQGTPAPSPVTTGGTP